MDKRRANTNWAIYGDNGWDSAWNVESYGGMTVAVLMDIRDQLQKLNRVFACPNFVAVPQKLDRIARNTHKPRRRKRAVTK